MCFDGSIVLLSDVSLMFQYMFEAYHSFAVPSGKGSDVGFLMLIFRRECIWFGMASVYYTYFLSP